MVSQTSEYALRAVACLARRPGEPMTTQQVAVASRVPAGYLAKILQALARAGIVSGQRGLGGGFLLARRPDQLTLLDVVRVADGSRRITACPLGIHGAQLCPLHRRLDDAAALAEETLSEVTIADVLSEPLCGAGAYMTAVRARDGAGPCDSTEPVEVRPDRGGTPRLAPLREHAHASPDSKDPPRKTA